MTLSIKELKEIYGDYDCIDIMVELAEEIARLKEENRWRDVNKELPKKDDDYLVYNEKGYIC